MAAHAKLSASGAHRWMVCPGSVALEATMPEPKVNVYAAEGTAAHALAEKCLRGNLPASTFDRADVEGWPVTGPMIDAVQIYLDYVNTLPGKKFIEQRVDFSPYVPDGFGTADYIALHEGALTIVDLKYGQGVRVNADNNPQAMLYALGTLTDFDFLYEFETFRLVIVQPRLDHISEWDISRTDLLSWAEVIKAAAVEALAENAPIRPNEKACRFCKAKAVCTALAEQSLKIVTDRFESVCVPRSLKDIRKLDNAMVAALLPQIDLVIDWAKSLETYAHTELENGRDVPGYKLVAGKSNRQWRNEDAVAGALRNVLKEEQIFTRKLVSPAQAEKLLGKGHTDVIQEHIVKPEGKPTLAPISDSRPAIVTNPFAGFEAA